MKDMSRRELHQAMNKIKRDKKFPFRPSISPMTERIAMSARLNDKYSSNE
jgi:hypothetical protein